MYQPVANSKIPTESFPIANRNILALVLGGQLTTDHLMGLGSFFAPGKESPNLLQGTRVRLESDGLVAECRDGVDGTTIRERGFVGDTGAVRICWAEHGLEVDDTYFIPPSPDVVIQRIRVKTVAPIRRRVRLTAIVYPQLGSEVHHKKGVCREARYDENSGALVIEDLKGNPWFSRSIRGRTRFRRAKSAAGPMSITISKTTSFPATPRFPPWSRTGRFP